MGQRHLSYEEPASSGSASISRQMEARSRSKALTSGDAPLRYGDDWNLSPFAFKKARTVLMKDTLSSDAPRTGGLFAYTEQLLSCSTAVAGAPGNVLAHARQSQHLHVP